MVKEEYQSKSKPSLQQKNIAAAKKHCCGKKTPQSGAFHYSISDYARFGAMNQDSIGSRANDLGRIRLSAAAWGGIDKRQEAAALG